MRGKGIKGDIALDDISVSVGSCPTTPSKADYAANLLTTTTSQPTTQFITVAPRKFIYRNISEHMSDVVFF